MFISKLDLRFTNLPWHYFWFITYQNR